MPQRRLRVPQAPSKLRTMVSEPSPQSLIQVGASVRLARSPGAEQLTTCYHSFQYQYLDLICYSPTFYIMIEQVSSAG